VEANMDLEALRLEFDADMRQILVDEREYGLCSTRFAQMLGRMDGVEMAKKLLAKTDLPPNTFTWLRNNKLLRLTMENYVALDKYRCLFTANEIEIAKWRLEHES
jgi:hypothetical protein